MAGVLVLGAYGVIGSFVARDLARAGHEVIGLGRDRRAARRAGVVRRWVIRDLGALTTREDWLPLIEGVDFVVNCAGALQSNPRDDLEVTHLGAIGALVLACEKADVALIQVSAAGADAGSPLEFYRTKAEGDAVIRESHARWWIFRPGFVLSPQAHGNTALIRLLASVPLVALTLTPGALIQTVSVRDVARAVRRAVAGLVPEGTEADLVEPRPHRMDDLVLSTRRWLGFTEARGVLRLPDRLVRALALATDALGFLGWRAPLRSAAVKVIACEVRGDPAQTRQALGRDARTMAQTMAAQPARAEDRLFARMTLLGPVLTFGLAAHWIFLGGLSLAHREQGVQGIVENGFDPFLANLVVGFLALCAVGLGLAMFVRAWAPRALWLMVLVCIFQLAGATMLTPQGWLDPLGPLVKVVPLIVLSLVTRLVLETR